MIAGPSQSSPPPATALPVPTDPMVSVRIPGDETPTNVLLRDLLAQALGFRRMLDEHLVAGTRVNVIHRSESTRGIWYHNAIDAYAVAAHDRLRAERPGVAAAAKALASASRAVCVDFDPTSYRWFGGAVDEAAIESVFRHGAARSRSARSTRQHRADGARNPA